MALPGFLRQQKPRGFNFSPRYYDPLREKHNAEDEQKRESDKENPEHARERNGRRGEFLHSLHRGAFRAQRDMVRKRSERNNALTIILIILLLVIIALIYYRF